MLRELYYTIALFLDCYILLYFLNAIFIIKVVHENKQAEFWYLFIPTMKAILEMHSCVLLHIFLSQPTLCNLCFGMWGAMHCSDHLFGWHTSFFSILVARWQSAFLGWLSLQAGGLPVTARHPHMDVCQGRMWVEMEAQPNYRMKNAGGNAWN